MNDNYGIVWYDMIWYDMILYCAEVNVFVNIGYRHNSQHATPHHTISHHTESQICLRVEGWEEGCEEGWVEGCIVGWFVGWLDGSLEGWVVGSIDGSVIRHDMLRNSIYIILYHVMTCWFTWTWVDLEMTKLKAKWRHK